MPLDMVRTEIFVAPHHETVSHESPKYGNIIRSLMCRNGMRPTKNNTVECFKEPFYSISCIRDIYPSMIRLVSRVLSSVTEYLEFYKKFLTNG